MSENNSFGVSSMTDSLKKVAMLKPPQALISADPEKWHYGKSFDPLKIRSNYKAFTEILTDSEVEILWMEPKSNNIADSVFTYDASFMTQEGAVLLSPGKVLRKGEVLIHDDFYKKQDIPIIGRLQGDAKAEGGDMFWMDRNNLIVGKGFRTNQSGIDQLRSILGSIGANVFCFDLPVFKGSEACLHMMSLISLVDNKKALAKTSLLPVSLLQLLEKKGFCIIDAPEDEFFSSESLSINVLSISPGFCVMVSGFPKTKQALENANIVVKTFDGNALCIGCEGGPTCLTRPILRQQDKKSEA